MEQELSTNRDANRELVRRFYREIWDAQGYHVIPELLHPAFRFRGSLGTEALGHREFADYVRKVHAALAEYRCHMEALVAEGDQVFAKMCFTGRHVGPLMGYPASEREVSWSGAALFSFSERKISSLWVLGDLKQLEIQLRTTGSKL